MKTPNQAYREHAVLDCWISCCNFHLPISYQFLRGLYFLFFLFYQKWSPPYNLVSADQKLLLTLIIFCYSSWPAHHRSY